MEYRDFNDHELLQYISESNEEAYNIMFDKYSPLITNIASKLFKHCKSIGLDKNDLIQEGMLGLSSAISLYDEKKDNIFYTFARKCIESKMISLIVTARRQKNRALNESLSLNDKIDSDALELEGYLGDNSYNPEYCLLEHENEEILIKDFAKKLTDLEEEVFLLKISGLDYKEISSLLDKNRKVIDNALQRIKIKLKSFLKEVND